MTEKTRLQGKVHFTQFHQGGIERVSAPLPEHPYAGVVLLIVALDSIGAMPQIVDQIKTDINGSFKVKLTPGLYGFILPSEADSLTPGQFLPKYSSNHSGEMFYSSGWSFESDWLNTINEYPVVVKGHEMEIKIVNHRQSLCMSCP
jgi:hypothetical protein